MTTASEAVVSALGASVAMLGAMELGWRRGRRKAAALGRGANEGLGGVDAGIYGLLGLLLAFSFGSAQARLETRRQHIVDEIDAVGTAYLRLDLLLPRDRDAIRDLTRRYLESRARLYSALSDPAAGERALEQSERLQREIWRASVDACRRTRFPSAQILLLNAINAMLDASTPRTVDLDARLPPLVWALLLALGPLSAWLAGHSMADSPRRSVRHMLAFALAVSVTFYVIVDLDSARFGLIRLSSEERMFEGLRSTMR